MSLTSIIGRANQALRKVIAVSAIAATTAITALSAAPAQAAGGGYPLDHFPVTKLTDQAALQNGAKLFVNYCLGCHSANLMRYNRLTDLGLTEKQIKDNLLFTGSKVGDMMTIPMDGKEATSWFGAKPPDLSVTARARSSHDGSGPDWLYTYLRSYYRDNTKATGWNNAVFPSVAMPHVLWELQGARGVTIEEVKANKDDKGNAKGFTKTLVSFDAAGNRTEKTEKLDGHGVHEGAKVTLGKPEGGTMTTVQFDEAIGDLVAFMTYLADPSAKTRTKIGVWVLIFLTLLAVFAWNLNRVYWKDVK